MRLPLDGASGESSAVVSKHAGQKPLGMSTSNDEPQVSQNVLCASRSIWITVILSKAKKLGPFLPSARGGRATSAVVPNRHSDRAISGSFRRPGQFSCCGANL